jgi:hypothetical protein
MDADASEIEVTEGGLVRALQLEYVVETGTGPLRPRYWQSPDAQWSWTTRQPRDRSQERRSPAVTNMRHHEYRRCHPHMYSRPIVGFHDAGRTIWPRVR